jgi:hypothetical protein
MNMGRYISSFGLNIEEVNNTFSGKDFKKINTIKKARTFFNYDDMTGVPSTVSVLEAMEDLMLGIKHDAPNEVYSCAILLICDALRITLPKRPQIQMGNQTNLINKCLVADFKMPKTTKIEEILFNVNCRNLFKRPFFIPKTFASLSETGAEDINLPLIAIWTNARASDVQEMFVRIQISDHDIKALEKSKDTNARITGLIYRNIRDLIVNINYCAYKKLGMIHISY